MLLKFGAKLTYLFIIISYMPYAVPIIAPPSGGNIKSYGVVNYPGNKTLLKKAA